MAPSPIRIFALPLTRSSKSKSLPPTLYWHVSQNVQSSTSTSTDRPDGPKTVSKAVDWKKPSTWPPPSTWPSESVAKASDLWLSWGTKPTYEVEGKKSLKERATEWKYWTWTKGEGLMDRVEWEEWALKSINPSVKVGEEVVTTDDVGVKSVHPAKDHTPRIPLLIPSHPSIDPSTVLPQLETYLASRIPYHKKYMKQAAALTPVMLPFGLLPVVPNFPFLIAAWRCFSHYRAWKGAEWLQRLVKEGRIEVKVDQTLQEVLAPVQKAIEGSEPRKSSAAEKEDHAPDETSTPEGMIAGKEGSKEVKGENAIQQTNNLLKDGASSTESSTTEDHQQTGGNSASAAGSSSVPDPENQDVAPDATGTPSSQIYSPSSDSNRSSGNQTDASPSDEALLTMENLPRLRETFGLSAAEVVDLTRAVMQIKDKAERTIESDSEKKVE